MNKIDSFTRHAIAYLHGRQQTDLGQLAAIQKQTEQDGFVDFAQIPLTQ